MKEDKRRKKENQQKTEEMEMTGVMEKMKKGMTSKGKKN